MLGLGIGGMVGTGGGALGTLFVRLAADSSHLVKGFDDGSKSAKIATAAIAGALATLTAVAVREFAKFDKAMTEAFSIMGDVSEDLKKQMSDTARAVARDSTKSAEEAAKSFYFLASAGLSAQESIKALPVLTKFATAGNFNMARATDLLADAQSALGLRTKDVIQNYENMIRVSDAITKGNILSNASVEQLSEALTNKAAPALRLVNKEVEEGIAVLSVFAEQGLKGESAGESLAIVLRDLQTASIENRKVFEQLGVEVFDAAGNMRNMADIMGQLERALKGTSAEERRMVFTMMGFQDRSVAAMLALVGFSDKIREYEADIRKAGGVTEEVANKQLTAFSSQVDISINRFKDLLITLGEELAPALANLNTMFQEATRNGSAANESWRETSRILGTVLTGAIKGVVMIWEGLRDLSKVVAMLWLTVAETLVRVFLKAFDTLQTAMKRFLEFLQKGVNLWIEGVNLLVETMPEKVKELLNFRPLQKFSLEFELMDTQKVKEWISILQDARKEIYDGLVKTVMGAANQVESSVEVITLSFENMSVEIGKSIDQTVTEVNRAKQLIASDTVSKALDKIGMPDKEAIGFDPFVDIAEQYQKEMKLAESRLKMIEELGNKEVELTREVQLKKQAAIEAYNKRLKDLQLAQTHVILQSAQAGFEEMANAARDFAGEQSTIYKVMFAASKAFAIADATVKIFQGIAAAASLTFPANLAAMASVIAATGSLLSSISSVTLALDGEKATGGSVRGGGRYLVGEHGPEVFSPSSSGTIIPNNRLGGEVKVVINNYTDARAEVTERNEGDQRVLEIAIRRIKNEMGSEIRDGRGELSRALESSYGLKRGKGQQ